MMNFDDNFMNFFDSIEEEKVFLSQEEIEHQEKYKANFIYISNQKIAFKDIPENFIKSFGIGTKKYEHHFITEASQYLITKYQMKLK